MKGVTWEYEGAQYRLALTAGALFDIYDAFGVTNNILSLIESTDKKAWENTCEMLEILSRYGEMQRRYLGEDALPYLKAEDILSKAAPTDVKRLKDAVRAAAAAGFSRSFEGTTQTVDLVLQQLDEKKTGGNSGRAAPTKLRAFLESLKKSST